MLAARYLSPKTKAVWRHVEGESKAEVDGVGADRPTYQIGSERGTTPSHDQHPDCSQCPPLNLIYYNRLVDAKTIKLFNPNLFTIKTCVVSGRKSHQLTMKLMGGSGKGKMSRKVIFI